MPLKYIIPRDLSRVISALWQTKCIFLGTAERSDKSKSIESGGEYFEQTSALRRNVLYMQCHWSINHNAIDFLKRELRATLQTWVEDGSFPLHLLTRQVNVDCKESSRHPAENCAVCANRIKQLCNRSRWNELLSRRTSERQVALTHKLLNRNPLWILWRGHKNSIGRIRVSVGPYG